MRKLHNLGVVVWFEIVRALKKPSFWLAAFGFPILIAVVFGIVFLSNEATNKAAEQLKDQKFSVLIRDESGVVNFDFASSLGAKQTDSRQLGIEAVQSGEVDAFFFYPKDISSQQVEVYAKDVGLFDNSRYSAAANSLLDQSVKREIDSQQRAILQNKVSIKTMTFRGAEVYDGVREMILPGMFLVLFYFLIAIFGNQMLTSSTEEKENRTIEMLLVMVNAKTLIVGKVLSLIVLSIVMGLVTLIPIIGLFMAAGPQLDALGLDVTSLPVDVGRIGVALVVFSLSFLLFTGILVTVGAIMPTAKEASQWFGLVILSIFGPLYGASAFVSYPDAGIVKFLTLFPLTSPIPLMLRNAIGNLPTSEAALGIAILAVSAILMIYVAVKVFRYGAMQYDSRLSLKALRARRE